ncbi:hypothetical protein MLOOGBEN_28595 [Bacillus sp. EB106-08-02-XG196]|jgi:hypothetical protein|nr:hypothetical protein [Bacillus sp. EB106-08-02-XG196]NWQ44645.1 hypothetical protein [Bacillus sp. EB106-08-02-XG196]
MSVYDGGIEAFKDLGVERTITEIRDWIVSHYPNNWVDVSTALADMAV